MQSPTATTPTQPPLPLRARGVLEILDAAVKLYRQFFWVLIGWSAIVTAATIFGPGGFLLYPFILPLVAGPVVCAVAAAVRGRSITFNQGWQFTQPRFGGMMVALLLASLVLLAAGIALVIISVLLVMGGIAVIASAPESLRWFIGVIGVVLLLLFLSVVGAALTCWSTLTPVVAAMEEDKCNAQALGRAWEMLGGHWVRIVSLMTMLGLGYLVLMGICGGLAALVGQLGGVRSLSDLLSGTGDLPTMFWIMYLVFMLGNFVVSILWTPFQFLLITLFYLDARVRKEALDIEWAAHETAPQSTQVTPVTPLSDMPSFGFAAATDATATAPATTPYSTARLDQTDDALQSTLDEPTPPIAPVLTEDAVPTDNETNNNSDSDDTIICPQCRTRSAADLTFCPACGTRLQPLW